MRRRRTVRLASDVCGGVATQQLRQRLAVTAFGVAVLRRDEQRSATVASALMDSPDPERSGGDQPLKRGRRTVGSRHVQPVPTPCGSATRRNESRGRIRDGS